MIESFVFSEGKLVSHNLEWEALRLARAWLETVQPRTVVRWSRVLEEDTSLSVDFAELAWMEGIELLKLEETGCLTLTPEEGGKWKVERWKQRDEDED